MDILIILVPIALALGVLGLVAFLWTLKHQQYDDLEGAASRILFDDNETVPEDKHEDGSSSV